MIIFSYMFRIQNHFRIDITTKPNIGIRMTWNGTQNVQIRNEKLDNVTVNAKGLACLQKDMMEAEIGTVPGKTDSGERSSYIGPIQVTLVAITLVLEL